MKPRPLHRFSLPSLPTTAFVVFSALIPAASGANVIWDGNTDADGADGVTFDGALNWSTNVIPSVATPDTAVFDGTVTGPLSLAYTGLMNGGSPNVGIGINLAATQVSPVSIDSGVVATPLRISSVTVASGAGAFTLGNGADAFNITLGGGASTQTFTNGSTNAATFGSDTILSLGGGSNHLLNFTGAGNWAVNSNMAFASGGQAAIYKTGAGTLTLSGGGALKEGATVNGGAIYSAVLKEGTTIFNGGTYTNNITTNNGEFVVGGLDTVGTNTSVQVNNATIINGIEWLSVGRGNGTGVTSSDLTLNNSASIAAANMSLGFNAGDATTAPKGSVTLNNTASISILNTINFAESPNSNFVLTLNGTSTLAQTANLNQTRIGMSDGAVGLLHINGGTATFERDLVFGYNNAGTGRLTLDSGTLNVANGIKRWLIINNLLGSKGELTINGGNINLNTNTDIRFSTNAAATGTSFVTLNGGAITGYAGNNNGVTSGAAVVDLNNAATGAINNTFNLNGGILTIGGIITGNDNGTAAFNFNGGLLKAGGNNANFLTLGGPLQTANVLAGGAKIDSNGFTVTAAQQLLSGAVADGGLTKSGLGNLILTGGISYNGATTVTGGTLTFQGGNISTSSGITANGTGAKVVVANGTSIETPVTITQGSFDSAGIVDSLTVANNVANTLDAGNGAVGQHFGTSLTFQGAAVVNAQATGVNMSRNFYVTNLTTNAAGKVKVNALNTQGTWTSGFDYPVIEYTGTFTGSLSHFEIGTIEGLNPSQTPTLVNTGNAIAIRITGESLVWTGNQNSNWSTTAVGGSRNWAVQGVGNEFTNSSPVIFDDSATRFTVELTSNVSPSVVVFSNDFNDYTLTSAGGFGITSGSLIKNGDGRLTIGTNNTYTGTTIINAGIVEVTGSIATSSTITVAGIGELILNPAVNAIYPNVLAGTGVIRKQGTAALTLSGASTFSGNFHFEGGTLNLNSAGALGAAPGIFEITGGVLDNTSGAAVALSSNRPQSWNTTNVTFTGSNSLNMGTGAVTLGGLEPSATINVLASTLTVGALSGGKDVIKIGNGTFNIAGGNLNAMLDIQAGIVGTSQDLTLNGLTGSGLLQNTGTVATKWTFWNINTDQTTGTLFRNNDGSNLTQLGIVKRGTGGLTLNNPSNVVTANLSVDAGRLTLVGGTYGARNDDGTTNLNLGSVVGFTASTNSLLVIDGATVDYNNRGAGTEAAFRPTLSIGSSATAVGAVRLNTGTLNLHRQLAVGATSAGYGAYAQSGGSASMAGFLAIGLGTAQGLYTQSGGTMTMTAAPVTNGAGAGSIGVMNLRGNAVFNHNSPATNGVWLGEAGTGILNISGSATLTLPTTGIELGRNNVATAVGILNLLGGTVTTNSVSKPGAAATGTLNFNGGTLVANVANATFLNGLTAAYVHAGGGSISNGGHAITIGQPLLAPTGSGVSATGLTVSGGGYIEPPVVTISGDGTGATAVASIDASGNLTGITITNPGTGYTSPPVFSLFGGGVGNTGVIGGTAALVANTSGGINFSGAAITTLGGANTYTGNTTIASGSTVLLADNAVLRFKLGANGSSNKVTGAGTGFFYGDFDIDTTGAAIANGNSWTLVDVSTRSYDPLQFSLPGFTESSNVWTRVDGANTWSFSEATGVLSLSVAGGGAGYATWIEGFGLAAADKDLTDDADRDGFNNLMEYVLGGNPNQSGTGIAPVGSKAGSNYVVTFTRNDVALAAADATIVLEYGNNLAGWTPVTVPAASGTVGGVVFTITNGSPNDTVSASIPNGGSGKFFARVKAVK